MGIFYLLSPILAYVMQFIYGFVQNYGWAIIIFTVLIRVVSFPLAIKQQKSTAKMAVYQPMIQEIQKKYANNREKQNEELMKMQQEYGYSPTAGCLPMILNMLVLFGVVGVVAEPLRYILHIDSTVISTVIENVNKLGYNLNAANYTSQSTLMGIVKGMDVATATGLGLTAEQVSAIQGVNMNFLGIDLSGLPSFAFNTLLIFPILSLVSMCVLNVVSMKSTGQEMTGAMKWMPWVMSLMFVSFCFTVPVGFSMYYTVSNVLMLVQTLVVKKIYDPEKYKAEMQAQIEAKRAEKKKKKQVAVKDEATGSVVTKEVSEAELVRLRLERARAIDEEKYRDERTAPLSKSEEE